MKKSTKILTTVIALVLVVGFMVVGIMAATSASANITAQVSWTATPGLEFKIEAWTFGSKEFIDLGGTIELDENYELSGENPYGYGDESSKHLMSAINVNTTMTNTATSGLAKSFNATFYEVDDNGVNNPADIMYVYKITNLSATKDLNINITKYPVSNTNVEVSYDAIVSNLNLEAEFGGSDNPLGFYGVHSDYYPNLSTTLPESWQKNISCIKQTDGSPNITLIRLNLSVLTPDETFSSFDAGISLSFS